MKLEKRIKELLEKLQNENFQFVKNMEEIPGIVKQIENNSTFRFMANMTLADDKPFKENGGQFRITFTSADKKFHLEASYSNQMIDLEWLERASRLEKYVREANGGKK